MLAVDIEHLEKGYARSSFRLDVKELKIETGSILGLLGPNGSGKTTLLKLLMDISRPDRGKISLLGHASGDRQQLLPLISYMPENKHLYNDMSVQQLLKLAAGVVPGFDSRLADDLLKRFSLDSGKKYRTLSFGEKTQLYAVITFARSAELYILDEPTRGLDPGAQEQMLGLIRETNIQNKTVVFSSHQLDEIEETADSIAFISQGRIILHGNLDDIKASHFLLEAQPEHLEQLQQAGLVILSSNHVGDTIVLLCRGDDEAKGRLAASFPLLEPGAVNLRDLYLNLMHQGRDNR